ncbi:MAG: D-aminoacyl-tRNA deacylase [Arthrobacter sp.]|uniref:D-aminoacyl-tRNA deacylase n=1 Tax=unclassified Arthrobacter TaxID=235627 RepID=UPI002650A4D0|nr:D-aminoacyl-tRNA deacylase [Micrococcaceae bacterium]MDN5824530.1 D-aminoacyl-tRNA deacylase [Micrococcaceae bacterium]MDN5906458.1 D-aminoacyl-tRNA deacylase [Micrococcaceae bacterium]MDN6300906.1 D-aminoacyl-tRNA deacylase [Micrococcaceae bacterium]
MKAVVQRVSKASVEVEGTVVGRIDEPGLLVLLGVTGTDTDAEAATLAAKIWRLRLLEAEKSCADLGAPLLVVSQFTLYGDVRKGRRPGWSAAAPRALSEPLYEAFMAALRDLGARVEHGVFGGQMDVSLVNSGPFTLIVDTADLPG